MRDSEDKGLTHLKESCTHAYTDTRTHACAHYARTHFSNPHTQAPMRTGDLAKDTHCSVVQSKKKWNQPKS